MLPGPDQKLKWLHSLGHAIYAHDAASFSGLVPD